MHFPVNIPLGKSYIPVHFVCETVAYIIRYRYYSYLRAKRDDAITADNRLIIFIAAAFGAFLGSHVIDAENFDVRAIKKSCVHIVNKDMKIIPFETMNIFYRDDKAEYLEQLRNEIAI